MKNRYFNWFSLVSASMLLSACSPRPFILVEQTATAPSFTVIPEDGKEFADKIERGILGAGLKVIARPPYRYMETGATTTDSAALAVGNQHVAAMSGHSITKSLCGIDIVAMYPDCKADYIVVTSEYLRQMRIIKKEDLSVIASGIVPSSSDSEDISNRVFSILVNAGFVKEAIKERECAEVERKQQSQARSPTYHLP